MSESPLRFAEEPGDARSQAQLRAAHNRAAARQPSASQPAEAALADGGVTESDASSVAPETRRPKEAAARSGALSEHADMARPADAPALEQADARNREAFAQLIAEAEAAEKSGDWAAARQAYERSVAAAPTEAERVQALETVKRASESLAQQQKKAAYDDLMQRGREAEAAEDWLSAKALYLEALAAAPDARAAAQVRVCGSRVMALINTTNSQPLQNQPINQTVTLGLASRRALGTTRHSSQPFRDSAKRVIGTVSITADSQDAIDSATVTFKGQETKRICEFDSSDPVGTTKEEKADGLTLSCRLTELTTGRNGSKGLFIKSIMVKVTASGTGG